MVMVVYGDRAHYVIYSRSGFWGLLGLFRFLLKSILIQLNIKLNSVIYQMHGMIVLGQVPKDGFSVNYKLRNMRNYFTYSGKWTKILIIF